MAASYRVTPVFESLFTSEYCKIFKSIFFEKHLQTTGTAASENVFMKLRKIKIYSSGVLTLHFKKGFFNINIRSIHVCFYFMTGFIFFLGIISWKGAFIFNGGVSFLSGGAPWGASDFDGRVFQKNHTKKGCLPIPSHQGKPYTTLKI